jgi:hypothetical protein
MKKITSRFRLLLLNIEFKKISVSDPNQHFLGSPQCGFNYNETNAPYKDKYVLEHAIQNSK